MVVLVRFSDITSSDNEAILAGGEDRTTNVAMGHGGKDAYEILAVTDGVVDAVRDAGRYASAAFARARVMLAKRGIRRLEAEGESV